MSITPQRIAVIGAGTAGLAAATLLARQQHRVTLIERAPALTPVGAGLMTVAMPAVAHHASAGMRG